jgi:hypothetical protein
MAFNTKFPAHLKVDGFEPQTKLTPPIKTWSFSGLQKFEECPYHIFLQKVKKLPDPSGPAAQRGSEIHDKAEQYVDGRINDLPKELSRFEREFKDLRKLYKDNKVECEGEWAYDRDWTSGDWQMDEIWLRAKLDVLIHESETSAVIIDHKTGQKRGNEVKHGSQVMLYAILTFLRFPKLEYVSSRLWYLDKGETTEQNYTREQAMAFLPKWDERANKLTDCVSFHATPNWNSCKWCSYKKSGECDFAYIK